MTSVQGTALQLGKRFGALRRRVYAVLEHSDGADGVSLALNRFLIALIVGFLYGGSLILGVIPRFGSNISWDGHLCGAIAGGIVAYALARGTRKHLAEGQLAGQDKMLER